MKNATVTTNIFKEKVAATKANVRQLKENVLHYTRGNYSQIKGLPSTGDVVADNIQVLNRQFWGDEKNKEEQVETRDLSQVECEKITKFVKSATLTYLKERSEIKSKFLEFNSLQEGDKKWKELFELYEVGYAFKVKVKDVNDQKELNCQSTVMYFLGIAYSFQLVFQNNIQKDNYENDQLLKYNLIRMYLHEIAHKFNKKFEAGNKIKEIRSEPKLTYKVQKERTEIALVDLYNKIKRCSPEALKKFEKDYKRWGIFVDDGKVVTMVEAKPEMGYVWDYYAFGDVVVYEKAQKILSTIQ